MNNQKLLSDEDINSLSYGKLKVINKEGYVLIYLPEHPNCNVKGFFSEHRFIVEKKLGRLLDTSEPVHHINGDRQDNRIQNLMPFHSQEEHKHFENKVKQFGFTRPILREINNRWENFK